MEEKPRTFSVRRRIDMERIVQSRVCKNGLYNKKLDLCLSCSLDGVVGYRVGLIDYYPKVVSSKLTLGNLIFSDFLSRSSFEHL